MLHDDGTFGEPRAEVERLAALAVSEEEAELNYTTQRIAKLEQLLAESEHDRAARLDNMHQLQALLDESKKDRAAELETIHTLQQLHLESEQKRAILALVVEHRLQNLRRLGHILFEHAIFILRRVARRVRRQVQLARKRSQKTG